MEQKQENRGGSRPNTGPKTVNGKKKVVQGFSLHPDVVAAFKKKYGRKSSARLQELIESDL